MPVATPLVNKLLSLLPANGESFTPEEIKTAMDAAAKGSATPSIAEITALLGTPVDRQVLSKAISSGMFVQKADGSISIDSEMALKGARSSEFEPVAADTAGKTTAETQRKEEFKSSMETLVESNALTALDNVESLDKSGKANNGRFGTHGMAQLAGMSATDDNTWDKIAKGIPIADRQRYIDAANVATRPDNAELLNEYSGGDSIFEKGELQGMVTAHMPKAPESDKNAFYGFARTLASPSAVKAMDNLEAANGTGKANNGRFGTAGITMLGQQSAGDDAFWSSIDPKLTVDQRQSFIDAAKGALDPQNAKWLNELSGGDSIFDRGEMQKMIAAFDEHSISSESIDTSHQGSIGDCWVLASVNAMAATPEGRELLQKSIFQNDDGSHTVTFEGDPEHPIIVTDADLNKKGYSNGDRDVRILETAFEKYVGQHPEFGKTTIVNGGQPETALTLLAGQRGKIIDTNYDAAKTKGWLEVLGKQSPVPAMTLNSEVGNDGLPGAVGNGSWHSYTIEKIDLANNTLTITNPWDSGTPIQMSLDEASTKIAQISFVDTKQQA